MGLRPGVHGVEGCGPRLGPPEPSGMPLVATECPLNKGGIDATERSVGSVTVVQSGSPKGPGLGERGLPESGLPRARWEESHMTRDGQEKACAGPGDGPCGPAWASAQGLDGHGAWADLMVGAVTQRLRWLPAGGFWMGSPDGEPGRRQDESRRWVRRSPGSNPAVFVAMSCRSSRSVGMP